MKKITTTNLFLHSDIWNDQFHHVLLHKSNERYVCKHGYQLVKRKVQNERKQLGQKQSRGLDTFQDGKLRGNTIVGDRSTSPFHSNTQKAKLYH